MFWENYWLVDDKIKNIIKQNVLSALGLKTAITRPCMHISSAIQRPLVYLNILQNVYFVTYLIYLVSGLEIYCFLVVNSYYCAMANEPIL